MLKRIMQSKVVKTATLTTVGLIYSGAAAAAGTGTEFQSLSNMLKGWSEGYLGLALALAAFVIGLAVGLVKQTVMPAIVGLGVALFATMGPGIIASMFTAVI